MSRGGGAAAGNAAEYYQLRQEAADLSARAEALSAELTALDDELFRVVARAQDVLLDAEARARAEIVSREHVVRTLHDRM